MGLQLDGGVPAGSISPKGRGQARRADVASAGEAAKDVVIGMLRKDLRDARVEGLDGGDERAQLRGVGLDRQAQGLDDGRIGVRGRASAIAASRASITTRFRQL